MLLLCVLCGSDIFYFQEMPQLYIDSHGHTCKRTKVEATAAIERISQRKIVIEHRVLRSDIQVAPFNFIYRIFQENGWLSIFDAVNIYPQLIYEFYKNLKVVSIHKQTPCLETKVRGTTLIINADVISEVISIPLTHAISIAFPDSVTPPPREKLMACFDPSGVMWSFCLPKYINNKITTRNSMNPCRIGLY
jgi:hypothetical protein